MADDTIFELTIHPGPHRQELLELLESLGIEDYVEAAADTINADDADWGQVLGDWSARDDAPLLIYRHAAAVFGPLTAALQQRFGEAVTWQGKWLPNCLWQEAWETDFQYLESERFYIGADPRVASAGKIPILLGEGAVFGSGQHATTQALVRLMESQQLPVGRQTLLDVGTGTGVVAFVAHHLGYARIVATDIEPEAIAVGRDNALSNQLPVEFQLGSLPQSDELWDAIACNILPPTLTDLLADFKARLKPQGCLYLAGFHEANSETINAELQRLGLERIAETNIRSWLAWQVKTSS